MWVGRQRSVRSSHPIVLRRPSHSPALAIETCVKELAQRVLDELDLDYAVILVSGGEHGTYEIVMWDRPRDSYFSLRLTAPADDPAVTLSAEIRAQLERRLASHDHRADRRPNRRSLAA